MPGPVSDSYDAEFGTSENATAVRDALEAQVERFSRVLGKDLLPIVEIANNDFNNTLPIGSVERFSLTERDMRLIRFALNRAIESI